MIANVTSGGDFGNALDYLMNLKRGQQERAREEERRRVLEQEPLGEADRAPPPEEKTREEARPRDGPGQGEPGGEGGDEPPPQQRREPPPEQARDLADEYEPSQRHRIIGGNMSGQTPRELEREFNLVWELRPNVEKPVHHASISLGERDRLTVAQWQEVGDTYVEKMGYQNSPHLILQHRWSDKDHIHVLASRIDFDGGVVSEWQSMERAEVVMREVEEKYDLERILMSKDVLRAAPTKGEREAFERTGLLSVKLRLQGHVEQALIGGPTASEFVERLQRVGVDVIPYVQETGRVSGVTFRQGDELRKGSSLGRGFSWGGLQKRGLDYDEARDRPAIEAARERAEAGREPRPVTALAAPEPEQSFADAAGGVTRSAAQHLLDQMSPAGRGGDDSRRSEQPGRSAAEGPNAPEDLQPEQITAARLQQAAGLEPAGEDAVERLREAAGLKPVKDQPGDLERPSIAAVAERQDLSATPPRQPDQTLENTPGARRPEHAVERDAPGWTMDR